MGGDSDHKNCIFLTGRCDYSNKAKALNALTFAYHSEQSTEEKKKKKRNKYKITHNNSH